MSSESESRSWAQLQFVGGAQESLKPVPLFSLWPTGSVSARLRKFPRVAATAGQHRRDDAMVAEFSAIVRAWAFRRLDFVGRLREPSVGRKARAGAAGVVLFFSVD
jgi:hypothetical protein